MAEKNEQKKLPAKDTRSSRQRREMNAGISVSEMLVNPNCLYPLEIESFC